MSLGGQAVIGIVAFRVWADSCTSGKIDYARKAVSAPLLSSTLPTSLEASSVSRLTLASLEYQSMLISWHQTELEAHDTLDT